DQHVVDAADAHPAGGAGALRHPLEQFAQPRGRREQPAVALLAVAGLLVLVLLEFLRRQHFLQNLQSADFSVTDNNTQVLGAGLDEAEPVLIGADVVAGENLHRVAVAQLVAKRDDLAVDLGAGAVVADFGVDGINKVDKTGPKRQRLDIALEDEDEDLVGKEV